MKKLKEKLGLKVISLFVITAVLITITPIGLFRVYAEGTTSTTSLQSGTDSKIATSLSLSANKNLAGNKSTVTLSAQIYPAISGETITFDYTTGTATTSTSTTAIASAVTDASGKATVTFSTDISKIYKSITALYDGNSTYLASNSSIANYSVGKAEQDFYYADGTSVTRTYSSDTYKNNVTDITGDGNYSYESTNTDVATVDASGTVTLVGIGNTIIKVVKEATDSYNQKEIDYNLNVTKASLHFEENPSIITRDYDGTKSVKISGGKLAGIVNNDDVSIDYTNSSCVIDGQDAGTHNISSANCVLTGTKSENYTLTQPTGLGTVAISKKDLTVTASIKNKNYDGTNTATVEDGSGLNGLVNGESVTLKNGNPQFESYRPATGIHVNTDFSLTGGANLNNYNLVQPTNLSADILPGFSATKGYEYSINLPDGNNGWFKASDFIIRAKPGYELSLSDEDAGPWNDNLTYSSETANGSALFYVRNISNKEISKVVTENYKIDKTAPNNLKISYSTSVIDKVLNKISFGFYKDPVTVTVSADDNISGVKQIDYTYDVDSEVSDVNKGNSGSITNLTDSNGTYTGTFTIDPQFRGKVSINATDSAGNTSSPNSKDSKVIVVDDIAPNIAINCNDATSTATATNYYNNKPTEIDYYNGDVTANVNVNEANFYSNLADVTVNKYDETNGTTTYYDSKTDSAEWNNTSGDNYQKQVTLQGDGDYSITATSTDYSGNKQEATKNNIVIDTTKPKIKVSYNDVKAVSDNIYNEKRTATVTIDEHNFNENDVKFLITQKDINGTNEEVESPEISSWSTNGDIHTATITFSSGRYTFDVSCKDLANNTNEPVDYGSSADPQDFVVDTIAPENLKIDYSTPILKEVLEKITFGFYKAPVTVNVSADDKISGIKQIDYSYKVDDTSTDNKGGNETLTELTKNGFTYSDSFQIPAQFRGKVTITATDKAQNTKSINDTEEVVVDDIAPTATITCNTPINSKDNVDYYNGAVTATLQINEANFWSEDVKLTVLKDGAPYDPVVVSDWEKQLGSDINKKVIKLPDDGHYAITLNYADKSGNVMETCSKGNIVVDTIAPAVTVNWNQPSRSYNNVDYYNKDATATISVTEANFFANDPVITATKNSESTQPQTVSDWAQVPGTNRWEKVVKFSGDGDYALKVSYSDRSGNVMPTYTKNNTTIDMTKPEISVLYDNNSSQNETYYKDNRVATIQVVDHNFNANEVVVNQTAKLNGADIEKPAISNWTNNGDVHTATIAYTNDGQYTLDASYSDLATNVGTPLQQQAFYIDKTLPVVPANLADIGVEEVNGSKSIVAPHITINDDDYDPNNIKITLTGSKNGVMNLDGSWAQNPDGHGGTYTFQNFPDNKDTDDVYTINVTATDKAGNQTKPVDLKFSVNRYGSTFDLTNTNSIKNAYIKSVPDIIIKEINPTNVSSDSTMLTLSKNGNISKLSEADDYTKSTSAKYENWSEYTYTVKANDFKDDGVYVLTLKDKDAANNQNSSDNSTQSGTTLSFTVDNTNPTAVISGLVDGKTYSSNTQNAVVDISDNAKLKSYTVNLNGKDVTEECSNTTDNLGNVKLNLDVASDFNKQNLVVDCVDEAGNNSSIKINNFLVNSNIFVQYYQNKPLFYGTVGVIVIIILGLSSVFILRKKEVNK